MAVASGIADRCSADKQQAINQLFGTRSKDNRSPGVGLLQTLSPSTGGTFALSICRPPPPDKQGNERVSLRKMMKRKASRGGRGYEEKISPLSLPPLPPPFFGGVPPGREGGLKPFFRSFYRTEGKRGREEGASPAPF